MSTYRERTLVEAIEDAAASTKTGYRFIEEGSQAEPFFTHGGVERARPSAPGRATGSR
jgi:fatty-acyl-CoA synthase